MYSKISDGLSIMKPTDFSPDSEGGEMYPNNPHIRSLTLESSGIPSIDTHDFESTDVNFQQFQPPHQQFQQPNQPPPQQYNDSHQSDARNVQQFQPPPQYNDSHQSDARNVQYPTSHTQYPMQHAYHDDVETPVRRPDDRRDLKAIRGDKHRVSFEGIPPSRHGGVQSDVGGGSVTDGRSYVSPQQQPPQPPRNPTRPVHQYHHQSPQPQIDDDIEFLTETENRRSAPPNLRLPPTDHQTPIPQSILRPSPIPPSSPSVPPPGLSIERGLPMCWAFCKRCTKKEGLRSCDCILSTNFICEKCGWVYLCHENSACKVTFWHRS